MPTKPFYLVQFVIRSTLSIMSPHRFVCRLLARCWSFKQRLHVLDTIYMPDICIISVCRLFRK